MKDDSGAGNFYQPDVACEEIVQKTAMKSDSFGRKYYKNNQLNLKLSNPVKVMRTLKRTNIL